MTTDPITNPHDKFFRETFSRQEVAHDFVKYHLPPEVVALLDLTTLEISKDSFIDPSLEEHFSDLLYQVALADGQPLTIYLLFDHKSYVDSLVSFQLLRYMVRIWELNLKQQHEQRKSEPRGQKTPLRLPPIFPLVVYHGLDKWTVSTEFRGLFDLPAALRPYVPNYSYWLADLSAVQDDDLKGYVILRVAVLLLKYIQRDELGQRLGEIFGLMKALAHQQTALEYLETILRYVSSGTDKVSQSVLQAEIRALFETGEETIMPTIAETWIEQGRQQVMAEAERKVREAEQYLKQAEQQMKQAEQQMKQAEQQMKQTEQQMKQTEQQMKQTEQQMKQAEQQILAEAERRIKASEQKIKASARKMKRVTIKNIRQTLVIRFGTALEQYDQYLQPLDLVTLERLNELAFTVTTLAEFEAKLPSLSR